MTTDLNKINKPSVIYAINSDNITIECLIDNLCECSYVNDSLIIDYIHIGIIYNFLKLFYIHFIYLF